MFVKRCLISRQLSLAAAGLVLLGGCGGEPADLSNLPGGIAADLWSAANGSGAGAGEPVDEPNSADTAGGDADTRGQFFSVVSGAQATRIYVDAGADQDADAGTIVQLDGAVVRTGVELEVTYHWEQSSGPTVTLSDSGILQPSFVAPTLDAETVIQFTLVVSAGDGSGTDSVNVTVLGASLPIEIDDADPNDGGTPPVDDTDPNDGGTPPVDDPDPNDGTPEPEPPAYEPPVAYAIDWGFDPTDSTHAIQGAINSGARTVVISNVESDWIVRPLRLASNQLIVFEPGVVVVAKRGSFLNLGDCLLQGLRVKNVTLYGYGATLRMQKQDYMGPDYTHGEWRHCIQLLAAENINVLGLRCEKSGGDGIYLGGAENAQGVRVPCSNIAIRDCTCDDNYRQGISVTTARTVRISNCVLSNTWGNMPQSGIDLECNFPNDMLSDIVISDCLAENNAGHGFVVQLKHLTATESQPVSVLFDNCRAVDCGYAGYYGLAVESESDAPPGLVEFRNCSVEDRVSQGGLLGIWARWESGPDTQLRFSNCVLQSLAPSRRRPIELYMHHVSALSDAGRVQFIDCTVRDNRRRSFLKIMDSSFGSGLYDVRGGFSVYNSLDGPELMYNPPEELPGLIVNFLPEP